MSQPLISIVINADTRPENLRATEMFKGVVCPEFLVDGVYNKIKFFDSVPDKEVILFVDLHNEIPENDLKYIREMCNVVCIRKHTNEHAFNDFNYLSAMSLARGKYIAKFDQDTAAFTSGHEPIQRMIDWLEEYKFVSYPSYWSPNAVTDPSFGSRTWASTRFFMTKRENIQFDNLRKCLENADWAYETYGDSPKKCNWMEHFLTLTNNDSCYYPPMDIDNYCVFSWGSYDNYILRRLNEYCYEQIRQWLHNHPIGYPNDVQV